MRREHCRRRSSANRKRKTCVGMSVRSEAIRARSALCSSDGFPHHKATSKGGVALSRSDSLGAGPVSPAARGLEAGTRRRESGPV